ncbi:MAG: sulfite exporter TauE/SafE family protein [Rhodospirillales bacterium]
MIADPWFYALAVPAMLIAGVSKGGFGGGVVVLGVPLMALVVPPQQAAAVMLPILMAMDVIAIWVYRRSWDGGHLRIILPASVIGVGVGWASFGLLDAALVRLLLGAIALGFSLDYWLGLRPRPAPTGPDRVRGGFWAMLAGFTSFVAHAGGPPLNVYMLPQGLEKRVFVGTVAVFFAVVNWLKLAPYAALGQLNAANLTTSAVLLPLAPAGIWLGLWLQKRIDDRHFYRVCYALLFVTGLRLAWDGVAGVM